MAWGNKAKKVLRETIKVKATFAEFLGAVFFLFIVVTTVSGWGLPDLTPLGVATVFGATIFCLEIGLGETSGGHFNPATSLAVCIVGGISVVQLIAYWIAQCAGAIAGACLARLVVGDPIYVGNGRAALGVGFLHTNKRAFLAEVLATLFLVLITLQVAPIRRNKKNEKSKAWGPLAIGSANLVVHLALAPIDGCSTNPARALGAATAGWIAISDRAWTGQWIFIGGPMVGATVAGIFKRLVIPLGDKMLGLNEEANPESPIEEA